jgi:prefoldin subunit 5
MEQWEKVEQQLEQMNLKLEKLDSKVSLLIGTLSSLKCQDLQITRLKNWVKSIENQNEKSA